MQTRPPLVCAHGGDVTAAPSNTARAFAAAIALGADCVEVGSCSRTCRVEVCGLAHVVALMVCEELVSSSLYQPDLAFLP